MPIWLQRTDVSLAPCDQEAADRIRRLKEMVPVLVNIDRVRSSNWHRLYFKRCAVIAENTGLTTNAVDARTRMMAGHVEAAGLWEGKPLYIPARIAFKELTADAWSAIWPGLEKAHEELLPGITAEIAGHSTW